MRLDQAIAKIGDGKGKIKRFSNEINFLVKGDHLDAVGKFQGYVITIADIVATDWVVVSKEISLKDIEEASIAIHHSSNVFKHDADFIVELSKRLGLE